MRRPSWTPSWITPFCPTSGMSTQVFFQSPMGPLHGSRVKIRGHMIAHRTPLSPRTTSSICWHSEKTKTCRHGLMCCTQQYHTRHKLGVSFFKNLSGNPWLHSCFAAQYYDCMNWCYICLILTYFLHCIFFKFLSKIQLLKPLYTFGSNFWYIWHSWMLCHFCTWNTLLYYFS